MGERSSIEWTDHTFNPVWGCTRVSPACQNCYAETWAKRFGVGWGPQAERRTFGASHWNEPRKWNREAQREGARKRVFCASMSDVFEAHPAWETERPKLWELIDATSNLDWLLLTKRPENILGMVPPEWLGGFPPNVWVGTTVENQEWAEKRIPHLLRVPARVRFLSCEPLLGPVDLRPEWLPCPECRGRGWYLARFADNFPTACDACMSAARAAGAFVGPGAYARPGNRVNWVIAGGESGHGVRPSHPDWFRRLRDDCQAAGVPFHFKQWGCWQPRDCMTNAPDDPVAWSDGDIPLLPDGTDCRGYEALADAKLGCRVMRNVGKKNAGRVLDGRTWDEMPAAENLNA